MWPREMYVAQDAQLFDPLTLSSADLLGLIHSYAGTQVIYDLQVL